VNDGANTFTYSYVAGQPGLVASIAANNGTTDVMTTTKTYDTLQRLVSISNSANTQTVSSHAYQYNTANQRTRATLADGSYWEYSYDSLGQVIGGVKKTAAGVPIPGFAFGYSFDHIGNRIDASENSAQSEYTSNALNQYTERTVPGVAHIRGSADEQAIVTVTPQGGLPEPVTRQGERFYKGLTFDNSTAPVEAEVTVTGVRPGLGPNGEDVVSEETRPVRIPQAPEEFAYDADGNLIGDGTWTCTWDAENRLISTSRADNVKVTYAYDSQSRRIRKTAFAWDGQAEEWVETSDTLYVWQDWLLLAEIDATSGDPVRTHLWGLDLSGSLQGAGGVGGLLCSTTCDPQPMTYVAAYDGNGNIMACLHASDGSLAAWFEYSPFGETLVASGSAVAGLPFRFSTRFTDPETGLVYYGHRYYNAGMGRWMSRDPIGEQDVANSYVSCVNAPILRRDYLGLASNWQVQSLLRDSLIHYRSLVDQPFVGGSLGFRWLAGMLAIEIGHIRESRQDGLGSGAAGIPIAALYRGGNPSRITIGTGFSPSNDWPYVIHELTHARNDRWLTPRGVDLSTPTGDRVDEGSAYAVEFLARAAVHLAEVEALLRGRSNCSDIEARLETPTNRWSRAWTTLVNPTLPDATEAYTNDGRSFSLTIWDFGYARRNHGICLPCGSVRDHYNGLLRAKGCSERLCFTCDTDSDPKAPIGVFNLAVPPYLD